MDRKRRDEYHIFVGHDDVIYFLAEVGSFLPDLGRGRVFDTVEEVSESSTG